MRGFVWIPCVVVVGCAGAMDPRLDRRVELPPAPSNGVQFVLPAIEIPAHSERQMCWYTTLPANQDVWVVAMEGHQNEDGGHHLVGGISHGAVPDDTLLDCTDAGSMTEWEPLLTPTDMNRFELPDGLAVRVPARTRLVFQTHYVNYHDQAMVVRDGFTMWYAPDPQAVTPAAPFATSALGYSLPVGEETTVEYDCVAPEDVQFFSGLGHMHDWGRKISIAIGPVSALEEVYRIPQWDVEYRDHPPLVEWDALDPFVMHAGETMRTTCTWENYGDHEIYFPEEMCATLFWGYPADAPVLCGAEPN